MKKLLLSGFALSCVFFSAQQQDIEEVVVKGKFFSTPITKVPENITVISKKQIQESPARSVADLLQYFTGMDLRRRGMNDVQTDLSIRGSSFEQVLVLINGIKMNDAQTGHNTFNLPFDMASIDRVEIIKGPAARRFGQNAYGGVINIITNVGKDNVYQINAAGGDFKTWSLGASADFGNENFGNFIQVGKAESAGYRFNTDSDVQNIWYQNQFKIKDANFKMQAGFTEKKFGANGFYSSPLAKDQYEETQTSLVSASYDQSFGNFGVNANVYWRRGQDMYLFNRVKPEIYRNMHIGNNIGGELNTSYVSSLGKSGLGVEFRNEALRSNNLGERERFITQVFFEHQISLLDQKLNIIPGVSWANYPGTGNFFYPGLDVGYNLDDHSKIYGNLAKTNRIPTYTDLYYVSKTETGNPNLKPENAWNYEIGYQYQRANSLLKVSGFGRNTDNAIDWTKDSLAAIWRAENISNIKTLGFETEIAQKFNWIVNNLSVGYTYLDNKINREDQAFSKYVLDNLRHQFNAKLQAKYWRFGTEVVYRYNERIALGSYNLLDAKLNYQTDKLNIYLLVNNITNAKYTETSLVPMPGRWFMLGFTFKNKF
ncbi:TonB-dependent receptor [Soonwooa sp.]|uniref:TonB-dependent receptor plug domain-containing protein n=1 Tax=Soonwooa sp. TaxID=1938592 RepID=UPI0028A59E13|nr:TonB-dependent receptor [Soonwooa sp.]